MISENFCRKCYGKMALQLLTECLMKISSIMLTCLATSSVASAAPRSADEIKAGISNAVERYASSISCSGIKVQPKDVLTLGSDKDDESLPKYAVLWSGDLGCFGGSGTEATHLAIATVNTGQYVVQPGLSSPVVAFESPVRFVTRVVRTNADTLVLEGREYAPTDPQSSPSIPVRFALRVNAKGDWRLVDKVRIEPDGGAPR
jgi:hypothetical protein